MKRRVLPLVLAVALVAIGVEAFAETSPLQVYGYFATRFEKTYSEPGLNSSGLTVNSDAPGEWSNPSYNLMLQQDIGDGFRAFANLSGAGGGNIELQNMWGEYAFNRYAHFRVGKMYRTFGLYNEILDAVPTYIGIEPPELFDGDHLMISRTTQLMFSGSVEAPAGDISYAVTTDNGEGAPVMGVHPIGADLKLSTFNDLFIVGTSAYFSNGHLTPDKGVGEGSPNSGILPWMANDEFQVFGGYFQVDDSGVMFQAAYWKATHDGQRDPASVVDVVTNAGVNEAQLARFLTDPNGAVDVSNVNTSAKYDVQTWYVRAGYRFETAHGQFIPYGQWDWYSNPETIKSKTWGGDNEAGAADDGKFNKSTAGLVYRPVQQVAIKLDGSMHMYKFNGQNESYPELRFDVSYVFGM